MQGLFSAFDRALGASLQGGELTIGQVCLRAVVVFVLFLIVVRMAERRLLARYSGFDVVVLVTLGAVLGRAINGSAAFWGSMAAAGVLVALHWILALLTSRWHRFGDLVKGHARVLVKDGVVDRRELRRNLLSEHDLIEMLRLRGRIGDPKDARLAILERNGEISGLPRQPQLRTVDIKVQPGVQVVRLEV
jgi:uncharacterized membrane protein YcaP (DUF421 family)